jgi:hypothetical protein
LLLFAAVELLLEFFCLGEILFPAKVSRSLLLLKKLSKSKDFDIREEAPEDSSLDEG